MSTEFKMPGGGSIVINDSTMIGGAAQAINKFNMECLEFHQQLMALGVRAYRCNDGWVDRKQHNVTFFSHEKEHGYYWADMHLLPGDFIFIGDAHGGGYFAIIDKTINHGYGSITYHYHLIEQYYATLPSDNKFQPYADTYSPSITQRILKIIANLFNRMRAK